MLPSSQHGEEHTQPAWTHPAEPEPFYTFCPLSEF
jgi:hypothetical protein